MGDTITSFKFSRMLMNYDIYQLFQLGLEEALASAPALCCPCSLYQEDSTLPFTVAVLHPHSELLRHQIILSLCLKNYHSLRSLGNGELSLSSLQSAVYLCGWPQSS